MVWVWNLVCRSFINFRNGRFWLHWLLVALVTTRWAHMLLACAIHHLKALIEEIEVSNYPHCLFYKLSPKGFLGIFQFFLHFFGHNFWTRNVRKPIQPSTDSYYNLVSNKILSQKIGSWCWHLGPDNLIQTCINFLPLWCHQQKSNNLKLSNFSF